MWNCQQSDASVAKAVVCSFYQCVQDILPGFGLKEAMVRFRSSSSPGWSKGCQTEVKLGPQGNWENTFIAMCEESSGFQKSSVSSYRLQ